MKDGIYEELNTMLVETFNDINRIEERELQAIGNGRLSITEFHLLACIGEEEKGMTIGEIAVKLNVTLPTVTVAVKRLEAKGFVRRDRNVNDGRSYVVSLSEEGRRMNRLHTFFHEQMIFAVRKDFEDDEVVMLYKLIKKLNNFFKKKPV